MLSFLPPTKVARTQRSPLVSVDMPRNLSQLSTTSVAAANGFSLMGGERVRPTTIAEAEISVGDVTVRPSVFLSGVGEHSCWAVDENTRLLRVWNMHKRHWARTAPRMAPLPSFTADEGLPLFVAELDRDESLVFCTDRGAVSSLDHAAEFRFDSEEYTVAVSAFACRRAGASLLTAVGTVSGRVLVAVKADGERIVVDFSRAECQVPVRTTAAPSSLGLGAWWRSWVPGRSWTARENNWGWSSGGRNNNNNEEEEEEEEEQDAVGPEFTLLRFRLSEPNQIWAVNAASEVFLLDFGRALQKRYKVNAAVHAKWATNISAGVQRRCRVVAFDETSSHLCCLAYVMPDDGHGANLVVVTLDVHNGAIKQTLNVQSIGSLAKSIAESPLHHTKIYLDDAQHMVTVLSGHYCVRLNSSVGVRSPCSSEDVCLLYDKEQLLGSSLLGDGRIVTLSISGPRESIICEDGRLIETSFDSFPEDIKDASKHNNNNNNTSYYSEIWRRSHFTGKREDTSDMARRVDDILKKLHIDSKMTLDSAVLETSDAISSHKTPHEGNWARANLDMEDENMVMYVTKNLVYRQQEHRRFLLNVLLHREIGPSLQAHTIAQLISTDEALLALVAIRRLQNDGSYPPPSSTNINNNNNNIGVSDERSDIGNDVMTSVFHHTANDGRRTNNNSNVDLSSVEEYHRLVRTTFEREQCQQLLSGAIIRVANSIRRETSSSPSHHYINGRATAAEIVFGEPNHLCRLLQSLGEHLCEAQSSVLLNQRTKFDEALSVASIFLLVTEAIKESREDMASLYKVPHNISMMLWTSSELENYGIQFHMMNACITLSNILSEVTATARTNTRKTPLNHTTENNNNTPSSIWDVPLKEQLRLLHLIKFIIYFSFRNHSQGNPSFYANVMHQTLFREPFLREPLGFPFGAPRPSADATIGEVVLKICEEVALEFTVGDILTSICLAKPIRDPDLERDSYKQFGIFCQRNPNMFEIGLRTLLSQRRELELQLLPQLVPEYKSGPMELDAFLMKNAPQLAWLEKPGLFQALVAEGVQSSLYLTYGDDLVTHRSRCLSMAKLAWVSAGAPISSTYYTMRLDEEIVAAQKLCLLPETKNVELGPSELVQNLLKQPSLVAWEAATKVACLLKDELRADLLTQILRRTKLQDGDALRAIIQDGASEREVARALEKTATGRILITAADQNCTSILARVWVNVLDATEQRLLSSWMQMRAAGIVA